jgi:hypothetical protein
LRIIARIERRREEIFMLVKAKKESLRINTKDKERELTIAKCGANFLLQEKVRYVPRGYTKGKWESEVVYIGGDEMRKLIAFVTGEA